MHPLILASASPRRKELLGFLQIPFHTVHANVDETIDPHMDPILAVKELAYRKAAVVAKTNTESCVIGSDTVVALNGEILGKPADYADAKRMLQMLSGATHSVCTGVALVQGSRISIFAEQTEVTFWELSEQEIETYIDSGEPFDKAGSYGIQGLGSLFVKQIHGDYFSVVGLPISRLSRELKTFYKE